MRDVTDEVQTWGEDDCLSVECICGGGQLHTCGGTVHRCEHCGRGYRTDMRIIGYEPGETDPENEEWAELKRRSDEWHAQVKAEASAKFDARLKAYTEKAKTMTPEDASQLWAGFYRGEDLPDANPR